VATVYVRRGLLRRNVGLEMLRAGLATVYEAKTGAEFGDLEVKYRKMEEWAKGKRRGIWSGDPKFFESPRDYKNRISAANEGKPTSLQSVLSTLASPFKGKS
jgi:endonuclease YncB( thermonuclease family)